jgi:hypothetical protein
VLGDTSPGEQRPWEDSRTDIGRFSSGLVVLVPELMNEATR